MTERPILFSAPMIRALLDGRKSQTRRVLKPQPDDLREGQIPRQLRIAIGDKLWVREAHCLPRPDKAPLLYRADHPETADLGLRWRPSIHMPRWASRLTLIVTEVRVQRLQEISEEDAIAEGVYYEEPTKEDHEWYRDYCEEHGDDPASNPMKGVWRAPGTRQGWGMTKAEREREQWGPTAQFAFRCIWESINGEGAWAANPWVAAYTFTVHRCNIDALANGDAP